MRLDRLSEAARAARAEAVMLADHAAQGVDPDATDPVRAAQTARILTSDPRADEMRRAS